MLVFPAEPPQVQKLLLPLFKTRSNSYELTLVSWCGSSQSICSRVAAHKASHHMYLLTKQLTKCCCLQSISSHATAHKASHQVWLAWLAADCTPGWLALGWAPLPRRSWPAPQTCPQRSWAPCPQTQLQHCTYQLQQSNQIKLDQVKLQCLSLSYIGLNSDTIKVSEFELHWIEFRHNQSQWVDWMASTCSWHM